MPLLHVILPTYTPVQYEDKYEGALGKDMKVQPGKGQEAWSVRAKRRGQQRPQYGACGGWKIPKMSWTWTHPHHRDVTQVASPMISQMEGSTYGGYTHMGGLAPHFRPT
ncbi:hypothetical protein DFH09DRAFT_1097771 [Mycena vulgaris]|nr:hypothetical protein DFH09DRAFT_1097771 [Mycena vulgaris]